MQRFWQKNGFNAFFNALENSAKTKKKNGKLKVEWDNLHYPFFYE